jgi:hypothetical protein
MIDSLSYIFVLMLEFSKTEILDHLYTKTKENHKNGEESKGDWVMWADRGHIVRHWNFNCASGLAW